MTTQRAEVAGELDALVTGQHTDPHSVLGVHDDDGGGRRVLRAWWPGATSAKWRGKALRSVHPAGVFELRLTPDDAPTPGYAVQFGFDGGHERTSVEPWAFWPTLGELDLHLIGEGRHERLWDVLGAHLRAHDGVDGVGFAVWAPSARAVRVVGDWNEWNGVAHPLRSLGSSGVWEIFVPGVTQGQRYKLEVLGADGVTRAKADPMAFATEHPPANASVVFASHHTWSDGERAWQEHRAASHPIDERVAVYEVHLGSWRRAPGPGPNGGAEGGFLDYDDLARQLADHVADLGFTHVELLPPTEHPYDPSWGYQVSSYFAPTARHGDPDGFRRLVDHLHSRGIGVLVDYVPAHFPRDDWALARFDGTALY